MYNIENKIINYIQKHLIILGLILLTIISIIIRWALMDYKSGDYNAYLINWWNEIKTYSGINSLGHTIGDYNVPYLVCLLILTHITNNALYGIKIFSICFDYICSISIALIIYQLSFNKFKSFLGYAITIFAPTLILNSSYWGQCDSIYVSFILLCIWQLTKENYTCAFILYSIAFSFKLEAILFLPVLIILYFTNRKFTILNFALIPSIFIVSTTPAIIAGRSMLNILLVLQNQTKEYKSLTLNYPNFYAFLSGDYKYFKIFGIWLTIGILGIILISLIKNNIVIYNQSLLKLSILIILICLFFLPSMHERYGLIIDLLSIALLLLHPQYYYITIGINFVSLIGYIAYFCGISDYIWKFTSIILFLVMMLTIKICKISNQT